VESGKDDEHPDQHGQPGSGARNPSAHGQIKQAAFVSGKRIRREETVAGWIPESVPNIEAGGQPRDPRDRRRTTDDSKLCGHGCNTDGFTGGEGERPREAPSLRIFSDQAKFRDSRGRSPSLIPRFNPCPTGPTDGLDARLLLSPIFGPLNHAGTARH